MAGEFYTPPGIIVKQFRTPIIALSLDQLYTAIRVVEPEADVHVVVEETLAAGFSGWVELPLPADRVCVQRFGVEWGDREVRLKWAIDQQANVACQLHTVAPQATFFEFARYWVKRNRLWLWRENSDALNPHSYHLSVLAVMPRAVDWEKWSGLVEAYSKMLLE